MSSGKVYKILNTLDERLNHFAKNNAEIPVHQGIIFGFTSSQNNCSYCVGSSGSQEDIPPGNTLNGAYFLGDFDQESIVKYCDELTKDKKSGKLLACNYRENGKNIQTYDIKAKKLSECEHEIVDHQEALEFVTQIQLDYVFDLKFTFNDDCLKDIENSFQTILENLGDSVFCLEKSSFTIDGKDMPNILIEDLYSQIEDFDELMDLQIPANMKKKMIEKSQKQLKNSKSTLQFRLKSNSKVETISEDLLLEKDKSYELKMPVKIFHNLQLQNNLQQLYKIFVNSLRKILTSMRKCFQETLVVGDENRSYILPKMVNFYDPPKYTHFVWAIYQDIRNTDQYKNQRKQIHLKYLVPMKSPTFKLINAFGKNLSQGKLLNVHVGLSSGIKNGQCEIVKGKYVYFHYNQDHINDVGWGCAYRSLQTIISWFQLQGYIEIENVPNHKQIQQTLIDVGDKSADFLGSSKWIGSQEVCYVLSHLYGIQSKIIFINSANELSDKARDLIQHFQVNGTPVMIGGGVLAHTIIGVDFDETTGNVKYLVLDPHYVGEENVSTIHKKQGCSWKPVSFWDKNSFYNLCLPQVPVDY